MPRGIRDGTYSLIVLAIAGFVGVAFLFGHMIYSKGYQRASHDQQAERSATDASKRTKAECAKRPTVQAAIECYDDAEKTSREHQRAEQDLNAQREMADWTETMLWSGLVLGVLTTAIAGLGVYWVRATLVEARNTTAAATAATRAAVEANALTMRENRPWIVIRARQNNVLAWKGGSQWFNWPFSIENHGGGVAKILSIEFACYLWPTCDNCPSSYFSQLHIPGPNPVGEVESILLQAGQESRYETVPGPPPMAPITQNVSSPFPNLFIGGSSFLWLRVIVTYTDFFGTKGVSSSCFRQQHAFHKAEEYGGPEYNFYK